MGQNRVKIKKNLHFSHFLLGTPENNGAKARREGDFVVRQINLTVMFSKTNVGIVCFECWKTNGAKARREGDFMVRQIIRRGE